MKMIKNLKNSKGFTILEILTVLTIVGIISSVVIYSFSKYADDRALEAGNNVVLSTLNQARSQSVSAKIGSPYGVHFENKTATIFSITYNVNNSKNVVYPIAGNANISGVSLAGGGKDVIFRKLVGSTNNYGSVVVSLSNNSKSKTISVSNVGLVSSK